MAVKVAFVDDNMVNRNTFVHKIQNFDDLEIALWHPMEAFVLAIKRAEPGQNASSLVC